MRMEGAWRGAQTAQRIRTGAGAWAWDATVVDHASNEALLRDQGQSLRLDRLVHCRHPAERAGWWVLDYKSAAAPERKPALLAQLQRYRAAVQRQTPGERVHAAFLSGDGRMVLLPDGGGGCRAGGIRHDGPTERAGARGQPRALLTRPWSAAVPPRPSVVLASARNGYSSAGPVSCAIHLAARRMAVMVASSTAVAKDRDTALASGLLPRLAAARRCLGVTLSLPLALATSRPALSTAPACLPCSLTVPTATEAATLPSCTISPPSPRPSTMHNNPFT